MIKKKLIELGFQNLPELKSIGNYLPYKLSNQLIFISGQLPIQGRCNKLLHTGKVESTIESNKAQKIIEVTTSNLLNVLDFAILENKLDLKKISCLHVRGYFNSNDNFSQHSTLFNHCSNLIVKILGEKSGSHSRSVIGVKSLPLNSPVEIDATFCIIA